MNQTSPAIKPASDNSSVAKPAKSSSGKSASSQRYARYKAVIDCAARRETFDLTEVKQACHPEQPGFVTRIVNELEQNGWIVREKETELAFRWNPARDFSIQRWLDAKLFGSQIKESPEQDRPRERLLSKGAEQLTNSELVAILVRSGRPGESAVMAGQRLSKAFEGRLEDLPNAGRAELKEISTAIEKTAYCQIMAGIELGRRVAALSDEKVTVKISSSSEAIAFCQRFFSRLSSDAKQEEFHIVTLDTKNQVIDTHQITVGTLDASLVHPREVFRPAIKDAASSVILVHNHPSGDPTPSREDIAVTRRLTDSGNLIGIDVLDHIVLGRKSSVSIQETM